MFQMLLLFYCILGTDLIDKYLFDYRLSGIRLGGVWAVVFISAYPLFGWRRGKPWGLEGRWSLGTWVLVGVAIGFAVMVVDNISHRIVHHFSAR